MAIARATALIADLGTDGMPLVVVPHETGFAPSSADTVVFTDHGKVVETDRLRRFLAEVL